ncbi:transcriptional regulator, TraR/DksA family protein [Oceanisphaera arctica]|uniref:Transcriptional regulator, TraR/DksA family protein n=1 Tax=Oceanisphaera arctica TaxID=641510 RepID=A0A2P5TI85_9GAMM|nr:transcriptional regulator, TraR/DksA family protein [Oceanisphaera arctica]PPL14342.1 transcriptional regulator, TraR/DksA family protein [Oceanisphaera arctica]GHA10124.1 RNA polymerase-binding protein DksA [Oceanisphaera arctica]
MISNITLRELEQRLQAEAAHRRQTFLQALQALDAPLATALQRLPTDEWADHPPLAAWPQLHPQLNALKQIDAALCQWQLGLYGLCSDCEAVIPREQLLQDPCRQRCDYCEQKYRKAQHGSWEL